MTHTVIEGGPHPLGDEQNAEDVARGMSWRDARRLWAAYDTYVDATDEERRWAASKLGVTL